jgi:glycosyltransferase involved in cell wall biosynthesis
MLSWQHLEALYDYDTVLINKTNPGWFVPRDTQTTVWYCHSTPRGLYDQFHRQGGHWLTAALKTPMRALYQPNTGYADAWACNSELVRRRLQRYWDIDHETVDVIYPPVRTEAFGPEHGSGEDAGAYVTVSRLQAHKRIDHLIRAFNRLHEADADYRLVVAGEGPDRDRLEALAGPAVEFAGYVDEREKARLLADAKAFVFAAENEDFGIAPIEAMTSGTPVLGVDEGFTTYQIREGQNGLTFSMADGELEATIRAFDRAGVDWGPDRLRAFAAQFGVDRFARQLRTWIARAQADAQVDVALADPADGGDDQLPESAIADGGSSRKTSDRPSTSVSVLSPTESSGGSMPSRSPPSVTPSISGRARTTARGCATSITTPATPPTSFTTSTSRSRFPRPRSSACSPATFSSTSTISSTRSPRPDASSSTTAPSRSASRSG